MKRYRTVQRCGLTAALLSVALGSFVLGGSIAAHASIPVVKTAPERMRGVNVLFGENNFDPTTEVPRWASWGINTIRLMLNIDAYQNNGQQYFILPGGDCGINATNGVPLPVPIDVGAFPTDPTTPYKTNLSHIDQTLAVMKQYGMHAIIVADHTFCRGAGVAGGNPVFLSPAGQPMLDHVTALWAALSQKYASDPTVVGYDLLNEPDPVLQVAVQQQYDEYYKYFIPNTVKAIRANDPTTQLVIEPAPFGLPQGYSGAGGFDTQLSDMLTAIGYPKTEPNVILSWHDYDPATYTVQNQPSFANPMQCQADPSASGCTTPIHYPGCARNYDQNTTDPKCTAMGDTTAGDQYWDRTTLQSYFQPVRTFQQAHNNIRVYVGEFGTERWTTGAAQWLNDTTDVFESWGWDWTFHSTSSSNEWNPTFTTVDPALGGAYGDVMTDRLQVLMAKWGLNPHGPGYGAVRLPYPVNGTYFTDWTGSVPIDPEPSESLVPPGWNRVAPPGAVGGQTSPSSTSQVMNNVLVHTLPGANPMSNPTDIQYDRTTYGFNGSTLYVEASLNAGTTAGSQSHVAIRDAANDEVDAYIQQDGTFGYHIADGSYDSGVQTVGPFASGDAMMRFDVTPHGVTFYRNGTVVAVVGHPFGAQKGYFLELRGTSNQALSSGASPVLIYARNTTITNTAADLGGGPTAARIAHFTARPRGNRMLFRWHMTSNSDIVGFNLYANSHRLNRSIILPHAAHVYRYTVRWTGVARFVLYVQLADGRVIEQPAT